MPNAPLAFDEVTLETHIIRALNEYVEFQGPANLGWTLDEPAHAQPSQRLAGERATRFHLHVGGRQYCVTVHACDLAPMTGPERNCPTCNGLGANVQTSSGPPYEDCPACSGSGKTAR